MNQHYPGQTTLISLLPRILGAIAEHDQFFELFCGTCQVTKRKSPVPSILVDKNEEVVQKALQGFNNGCSYIYLQQDVFEVLQGIVSGVLPAGLTIGKNPFIYLDPPWRVSRLGQGKPLYKFNLTDNETAKLLLLCRKLKFNTAILHYRDDLYDDILNDWHRLDTSVSYRGRVCEVSLYCNYDFRNVKLSLSDLAGKDRTDRQRIKRKAQRWVKSFESLPVYEQQAIFEAIKKKY